MKDKREFRERMIKEELKVVSFPGGWSFLFLHRLGNLSVLDDFRILVGWLFGVQYHYLLSTPRQLIIISLLLCILSILAILLIDDV